MIEDAIQLTLEDILGAKFELDAPEKRTGDKDYAIIIKTIYPTRFRKEEIIYYYVRPYKGPEEMREYLASKRSQKAEYIWVGIHRAPSAKVAAEELAAKYPKARVHEREVI